MNLDSKIREFKTLYLKRYNNTKSIELAKTRAINAAIQHNRIYLDENLTILEKKNIRNYWADKLDEFNNNCGFKENPSVFIEQVVNFRDEVRSDQKSIIFKISHAQKSLSVYAKHLWCLDLIDEPSICPIDRIVLSMTNCPIDNRSWTNVDDINHYMQHFDYIEQMAKSNNLSIARWELFNFNP